MRTNSRHPYALFRVINNSPNGSRLFLAAIIAAIVVMWAGCVDKGINIANTQPPPSPAAPVSVNTNTAIQPVAPQSANVPVTLPMMDALLSDGDFSERVKSELQLSDEEIQKLKDAGRDAVLNLDENDNEDNSRSTVAAARKAEKQINTILGGEKGGRFLAMVRQNIAASGEPDLSAKPNSVPTDTRIVVNAPEYRMDIFQNGQLRKTYKIGIGYPEFPLPTGLRKAETIIFNPTWTPPDEPWVKGKFKAGKTVDAGSKDNPLGPIKIPIGLPSLIHGGKAPSRLGTFASHGCVGLTTPQIRDFVGQLSSLSGPNISDADLKEYLSDKGDTKTVKLDTPVPVELRYETIVVEDGKLKIFRDVYERGTNNEENLRRVLDSAGVSLDSLTSADREKIISGLKEMAYDATGNPVDEADASGDDNKSNKSNPGGKITKNIKGKKEVEFVLPQLSGKGYPAPANLMSQ